MLTNEQAIAAVYAFQEYLYKEQSKIGPEKVLKSDEVKKGEVYRRLQDQVQKFIDHDKQTNQQIQIEFFKPHNAAAAAEKKTVNDLFDFAELDNLVQLEQDTNQFRN